MVTVDTKLISLLGNPLRQTYAPQMFNETFKALNMDYFYFPVEVSQDHLETIVNAIRCMNYAGFNVTKPNKTAILEHLDELDSLAATIGSVNVVVMNNGVLKGYNTDGIGFLRSIREEAVKDLTGTNFLIMGAGGASRAICSTLAFEGVKKLFIIDRIDAASSDLAESINTKIRDCAVFVPYENAPIGKLIEETEVLVNATGIGMYPNPERSPVEKALLRKHQLVVDITYNPAKTQLLLDAGDIGCRTMNGLSMAIHQGISGFSLMTGRPEPLEIMTGIMHEIETRMRTPR